MDPVDGTGVLSIGDDGIEISKLPEEIRLEGNEPVKLPLLSKENVFPELVILSVSMGSLDDLRLTYPSYNESQLLAT